MLQMTQEQRDFFRKERTIVLILLALFMLLSTVATMYINGERKRNRILIEYRVERAATALFESYRDGVSIDDDPTEEIVGFGVYNYSGTAVMLTGDAPESVRIAASAGPSYTIDRRTNTITMIRPIGLQPFPGGGMMGRRPTGMANLFVRIDAESYLIRRSILSAGYLAGPVVIACILLVIGRLYFRTWRYQNKIKEQQNLVYLGEASRTLTHEIRNPLSAIQLQTGILRRILPAERKENLDVIDEEVTRLSRLAERIRDFVKNPIGEPADVDIIALTSNLAERYSWSIDVEAGETTAMVRIDEDRLRSVMENLIRNSVEASEPGNRITVVIERQRSKYRISVLDRGRGIPEKKQDQLFDPFFTMKESGSGIGLAISKRFVDAAGGTLVIRPRKDGGTEAAVTLPASTGA